MGTDDSLVSPQSTYTAIRDPMPWVWLAGNWDGAEFAPAAARLLECLREHVVVMGGSAGAPSPALPRTSTADFSCDSPTLPRDAAVDGSLPGGRDQAAADLDDDAARAAQRSIAAHGARTRWSAMSRTSAVSSC